MGLLDRWLKKKMPEQLSRTTAAPSKKEGPKTAPSGKEAAPLKETVKKEESKTAPSSDYTVIHSDAYQVLIRPLVTEKAAVMESNNKYSFMVAPSANKMQIKQAIKELYGVEPLVVNIINVQGRRIRFGRTFGRRSDYKKAIITLPLGKSITIHEGV